MKSDNKIFNICLDILRQMYNEATPSADLDKLIESGETKKEGWFENYTLSMKRQQEILDEHCKKNKCNKYEKDIISASVILGGAPYSDD